MTIETGDSLPDAELFEMGIEGPEAVRMSETLAGRRVVIFAVPAPFSGHCTSRHVPSFVETADALRAKGIDDILCVAVSDAFAMRAFGEATGGLAAGIRFLGDPRGDFTTAIGAAFDFPPHGMFGRSKRYAMIVENGIVQTVLRDQPGQCEMSVGTSVLEAL